jgi:hypothetical protein
MAGIFNMKNIFSMLYLLVYPPSINICFFGDGWFELLAVFVDISELCVFIKLKCKLFY